MYLFFVITGLLFVIGFSIVSNFIYSIFSVNKVTNFLNSNDKTTFNNINICILPNIIWSFIELPLLGYNSYFILGLILNIFINCSVMYIIVYGYSLISNQNNEISKILAIIVASIFGFTINYICLLAGHQWSIFFSIGGVLIILILYIIIKLFPPKSEFFRGIKE